MLFDQVTYWALQFFVYGFAVAVTLQAVILFMSCQMVVFGGANA